MNYIYRDSENANATTGGSGGIENANATTGGSGVDLDM